MRVKTPTICIQCGKKFYRHNGNTDAKFCSVKCSNKNHNVGEKQIKAGRIAGKIMGDRKRGTGTIGYIKFNQRHEHRTVMEKKLGRPLKKGEIVHHIDENKHNNHPDNLQLMTQAAHCSYHFKKWWKEKKHEKEIHTEAQQRDPLPDL